MTFCFLLKTIRGYELRVTFRFNFSNAEMSVIFLLISIALFLLDREGSDNLDFQREDNYYIHTVDFSVEHHNIDLSEEYRDVIPDRW